MTRSADLGKEHVVTLTRGEVRYFERGSGRPIVFVHGVLTNADLWRAVVPDLAAAGFRCLAPDLPLGAHEHPLRADADLSPVGNAELIADFLAALDLRDVILVACDTGGALTQIMLSRRPERVDRVVLLPSDCFEYFFPPIFRALPYVARVPGALRVMAALLRVRAGHRLPFVFGWVTKRPVPPDIIESYLWPVGASAGVRRDLRKLLREVHPRHTLAAAEALRRFGRPVLLLWGAEDKLFPPELAHRLAGVLPDARVVEVADTYTFMSEDRPAEVVAHVIEFAGVMAD
ncbi:alpha/beta fold hydrolase [Actinophytocola oryzae]|uniref:Pimeloyl-ACP methyl ester carboxylesterase n=1 Tax=Actinophytocola oryzae TaxID=502181 RepID=A0A4R7V646_9PSEU|nr:alpha/beta hydrolase [Actinophytocola oryzae]TDV44953.1 pimeloyl-ACP methyl ester carboxylesterase [Actinophytocola oryzae]